MRKHHAASALIIATLVLCFSQSAKASILVKFQESGSNVIFTATGSLDLSGLTYQGTQTSDLGALFGIATTFGSANGPYDIYGEGTLTISGFWPNTGPFAGSGDTLLFQSGFLGLPGGYVSGTDISSLYTGFTIADSSFASLGLTIGSTASLTWDSGANGIQSVTFEVVPEPSTTISVMLIGGCALLFRARGGGAQREAKKKARPRTV